MSNVRYNSKSGNRMTAESKPFEARYDTPNQVCPLCDKPLAKGETLVMVRYHAKFTGRPSDGPVCSTHKDCFESQEGGA